MEWVEGKTFVGEEIKLDYTRWRRCHFINCNIIVKQGETDLIEDDFMDCHWTVNGPAEAIMKIMAMAFPTIPYGPDAAKDHLWIQRALDWINHVNPEAVKKWVFDTSLAQQKEDKT